MKKHLTNMRLFGEKKWIMSIIGLVTGMILTAILLKLYFGEIKFWILIITGIIGLIITLLVSIYANK